MGKERSAFFNIEDVARIHKILRLDDPELKGAVKTKYAYNSEINGEVFCRCPFCGDLRGKFSYVIQKGNKKNMFNCYACDEHGSAIVLHQKLTGKTYDSVDGYKQAIREIFHAMDEDVVISSSHREFKDVPEEYTVKKEDGYCSRVYQKMLSCLVLDSEDKQDLLRRGLSEEQIKKMLFRSVPRNKKDANRVVVSLLNAGYDLEGIPGFYKEGNNWMMKYVGAGYFCPVYDGEKNMILGFQVRLREPIGKTKYIWFSSAGKEHGTSSGGPATFLPGKDERLIIITEGILKAIVIWSLLKESVSVIGVAGVKNIKSIDDYLERYKGRAFVFEAYDMDKAIRTDDKELKRKTEKINADKLKLTAEVSDYEIPVHGLTWDMDKESYWLEHYKGLDDFLLAYDDRDKFLSYLKKIAEPTLKLRSFFKAS